MAVRQWPENQFLVREGVTYSEFLEQVRARAVTLVEQGIKPGDVVGGRAQKADRLRHDGLQEGSY